MAESSLEMYFKRGALKNQPLVKIQVAKRMYIITNYLSIPPSLRDGHIPTLEESFTLLGRAEYALDLIEEIGKILRDALSYNFVSCYPKETLALRDLCRERVSLAKKFIKALTFKQLKDEGKFEREITKDYP